MFCPINLAAIAIVALIAFSFTTIEDTRKVIKVENSDVSWKAYKVTGSHEGTIALKSGFLTFNEETLTGGEFVIDMTSLTATEMFDKDPTRLVEKAVKGMLPKNKLGSALFRNLYVYAGAEHKQEAQSPKAINLNDLK